MAQQLIARKEDGRTRCHNCRYWFERCCHALALLEGDDKAPGACAHFVIESAQPHRLMEVSP